MATIGEKDIKDLTTDDINRFGAAFNSYKPPTPGPTPAPIPGPTPPPGAPPISRTIDPAPTVDPNVAAAQQYQSTFVQPESRDQIIERRRKEAAALVESTNKVFDDEVFSAKERGQERLGQRNALSISAGLMGGSPAIDKHQEVTDKNAKEVQAINNQRGLALAKIYTDISADADKEAREQLEDARRSADEIVTRQKTSQEEAVKKIQLMASAGLVDYETFKSSPQNKKVYDYALQAVGGSDEALKATFALSRPAETVIASQWQGSKLFQVYRHPVTGATRTEIVDLGSLGYEIPNEYSEKLDLGNEWFIYGKGNPEEGIRIPKAPNEEDALRRQSLRLDIEKKTRDLNAPAGGFSKEETALRKEFNLLPEVKQIANIRRSYSSAVQAYEAALEANATKGSKAAADQALVTLFNKMLDPESVVREGEYARSFQGQSAIARLQGYTERVVQGGAGLTDANRKDMVDIAKRLYDDAESTYKDTEGFYKSIATDSGLNPERIFKPVGEEETGGGDAKQSVVDFAGQSPENRQIVDTLLQNNPEYTWEDVQQIMGI